MPTQQADRCWRTKFAESIHIPAIFLSACVDWIQTSVPPPRRVLGDERGGLRAADLGGWLCSIRHERGQRRKVGCAKAKSGEVEDSWVGRRGPGSREMHGCVLQMTAEQGACKLKRAGSILEL